MHVIKPEVQQAWRRAAIHSISSSTPRALTHAECALANKLHLEVAYARGYDKCRSLIGVPSSRGGHALWPPGESYSAMKAAEKEWNEASGQIAEFRQLVDRYEAGIIEDT